MTESELIQIAQEVFDRESDALEATRAIIGQGFLQSVQAIYQSPGKVVTMGIGKSGLVARKIAATLASTGTSAVFVHPVECLHGDMGIINKDDMVIVLSTSGESDEIRKLLVFLKNRDIKVIAVTASPTSHLAQKSDIVIPFSVPREADPMGMAPMASTTVQMVIGDALAAALIKLNNFKAADFALFHPSGALGKRLILRVNDVMHANEELPIVREGTFMSHALVVMTEKAMGAVLIVDSEKKLKGLITDGDLRRALQSLGNILDLPVERLMTIHPISIKPSELALDALKRMEKRSSQISVLPVVDDENHVCGILRLHDLVLAGL